MKAAQWNCNRTRFILTLLLSASFFACASNHAGNTGGPLEIPADIAGIVHAGRTNTPEEYALLDRLGVSWMLVTFTWNRIESSEGRWDFDFYDQYVDTAQAAGKKIVGVLAYDVPWIHNDGKAHRYIPPDKVYFFLDYVRQTAAHFRGRVDAWCIWNEPNSRFWQGSRDEFLVLARQAANAVKETDPDVTLLGGAFNRGIFGLPTAYIRGLFESGAMEKADAVAFHPYELNPARTVKLYGKFRAIAAEYGFGDRIWITEAGYPTGGWYPTATTEKKFPAYIVKTFVNLTVSGAKKILWYQLFDPVVRDKKNSENFFGLVRSKDDYTSKGAEAFRLCAVYLAGTVYRPDLPVRERLPSSLKTFYFKQPAGGGTLVLWKEGSPLQFTLQIPEGFIMHDPVSGNAAAVPAEADITVGSMPVFITWQGDHQPLLFKRH
ncbi:MAG: beta-galactosidase [Treponema sp.]|nr:beta-galactosidase [Treponema sp.]